MFTRYRINIVDFVIFTIWKEIYVLDMNVSKHRKQTQVLISSRIDMVGTPYITFLQFFVYNNAVSSQPLSVSGKTCENRV